MGLLESLWTCWTSLGDCAVARDKPWQPLPRLAPNPLERPVFKLDPSRGRLSSRASSGCTGPCGNFRRPRTDLLSPALSTILDPSGMTFRFGHLRYAVGPIEYPKTGFRRNSGVNARTLGRRSLTAGLSSKGLGPCIGGRIPTGEASDPMPIFRIGDVLTRK